jgi:hypothetical protein
MRAHHQNSACCWRGGRFPNPIGYRRKIGMIERGRGVVKTQPMSERQVVMAQGQGLDLQP